MSDLTIKETESICNKKKKKERIWQVKKFKDIKHGLVMNLLTFSVALH